MKKASVRDLRYRFSEVETLLASGEEVQVTRRKRVIARLLPPETPRGAELPDFLGRMQAIFGDRSLSVSGADVLREERDRS